MFFLICVTFWIIAVVLTGMKNYFCKLGIVSVITKYKVFGTSLLITQPEYYYLLLIQELSWNLEIWVISVRMENIWTSTAVIPDFKISFRYSLSLFSEATVIVLLCPVSFETQQFINEKYNPKNQSPTNHLLHLSHIIKAFNAWICLAFLWRY